MKMSDTASTIQLGSRMGQRVASTAASAALLGLLLLQQCVAFTTAVASPTPPLGQQRQSSRTTASRRGGAAWIMDPRGGSAVAERSYTDAADAAEITSTATTTTTTTTTSSSSTSAAATLANSSNDTSALFQMFESDPSTSRGPLKVLFLSSDTGGGHRASAESLAKQFLLHYPGSTYDIHDIWTTEGILPYSTLVQSYKHLSAHPRQWRVFYHVTNTAPWEFLTDLASTWRCERLIRKRLAAYNPDVIVSVHPTMNFAPRIAANKLAAAAGKHIPFVTVVTDLGSAHCTWFHKQVDRLYVASDRLYRLAKRRGGTPDEKLVKTGLPIRHDFAVQAANMGDRTTATGQAYQAAVKRQVLQQDDNKPMILLMGGGEGVGSLKEIVDQVYAALVTKGIDATICVVCGRNEKLQQELQDRDWNAVLNQVGGSAGAATKQQKPRQWRRRRRRQQAKEEEEEVSSSSNDSNSKKGDVQVVGLGFVTNMDEYMVAADILVTKAGPGTIAEAAAVGLPVMLTSFLPGQEAGNVDYVLEKGFGEYSDDCPDIAQRVSSWLQDPAKLSHMSRQAQAAGRPDAASEIVRDIGSMAHTWMALNGN